jgi:YggT family protein
VALAAALAILRLGIYLAMGVVIVAALLSWINPYAPMAPLFNALARPLLRPFQRLIPPIGGVDLSPIALLLVLQVLLMVLSRVAGSLLVFR